MQHMLVHFDYEQFCCPCGKSYKRKDYVKQHFKRCADRVAFTDAINLRAGV